MPSDAETVGTVEVSVVPEGATNPVIVTLTKNTDGSWTSNNEAVVPSTTAGANADSTTIPESAVQDGSTISATAKDPSGNASTPVEVVAKATSELTITTPIAGDGVVDADEAAEGFVITGTGMAGENVTLTNEQGAVIGTVVIGDDNRWSIPVGQPDVKAMGEGAESLSVTTQSNASGVTMDILIDSVANGPLVTSYTVEKDVDGEIVGGTISGTSSEEGQVFIDLNEDGVLDSDENSAVVDADGNWTLTLTAEQAQMAVDVDNYSGNGVTPLAPKMVIYRSDL